MNIDALRMALSRRGGQAPALLHSDQGSQYAAADYQAMLKMHNINLTRAGIGEAAFALTCRLDTGVPRVSPGTLPVT
jgi:putative transposase